jgi:DNA-binding transcriptional ArsR family regulator
VKTRFFQDKFKLTTSPSTMSFALHTHFVYDKSMNAGPLGAEHHPDDAVSSIAAAIGEPARARILYCLMDSRARTSTELAMVADVSPSTASVHLNRLRAERLVKVFIQGKHRYYSLNGPNVGSALEALSVLAGGPRDEFVPTTPSQLQVARTCYDHLAGTVGVSLHDRFKALGWLAAGSKNGGPKNVDSNADNAYDVTAEGAKAFAELGIDLAQARMLRRQFAYACLDWSERRPHLGGALGAALLKVVLKRKWLLQDLDSRALVVTRFGRREILTRFGLQV